MARTYHDARDDRHSGRASRAMRLRAADALIGTLDDLADRREARHAAELERAETRISFNDGSYRIPGYREREEWER